MDVAQFGWYVKNGSHVKLWRLLARQGYIDKYRGLTLITPDIVMGMVENPVYRYLLRVQNFRDDYDFSIDSDIVDELWRKDYDIVMKNYFGRSAIVPVSENRFYECDYDDTKYLEYFLDKEGNASLYEWNKYPDGEVDPVVDLKGILSLHEAELFELFLKEKGDDEK